MEILTSILPAVFAGSKWKIRPESGQYQCQNGAMVAHDDAHTVDCLQIFSEEKPAEKAPQEARPAELNRRPLPSKPAVSEPKERLHCGGGAPESPTNLENLPQEEQGSKATKGAKNSSPKARRGSTNTPSPPGGKSEKKQRSSFKTISPSRDAADKSTTAAQNFHAEQINKSVTCFRQFSLK